LWLDHDDRDDPTSNQSHPQLGLRLPSQHRARPFEQPQTPPCQEQVPLPVDCDRQPSMQIAPTRLGICSDIGGS